MTATYCQEGVYRPHTHIERRRNCSAMQRVLLLATKRHENIRNDGRTAIERLAERCRGLLYFAALTREDWQRNCDQSRTDPNVHLRSTRWYTQRLGRAFRNLGGGLYVRRDAPVVVYSLHALD